MHTACPAWTWLLDTSQVVANNNSNAPYVLIPIDTEEEWKFYKDVVKGSQVNITKIVVQFSTRDIQVHGQDEDDHVEHITQEDVGSQEALEEQDGEDEEEHDGEDDEDVEDEEASVDEDDFDSCRVNNNFDDVLLQNVEVGNDDISKDSEEAHSGDEGPSLAGDNIVRRQVPLAEPVGNVPEIPLVQNRHTLDRS